MNKNINSSEISIDEDSHEAIPTFGQRLKNALTAVVMGIVLVQIIFWSGLFKTGGFGWGASVVLLYDDPVFLGFLLLCAIMGGWKGRRFIYAINREIGHWRFW